MMNPEFDHAVNDPIFSEGTTYFDLAQDRVSEIERLIARHRPKSVLDIGFFPGYIGRYLKDRHPGFVMDGVGKFNDATVFPGYDRVFSAEFDPFYGKLSLPAITERYDLIIACEIIEHLITPLPMLRFIADRLSDNGIALITTPNVSNFGAACRLLLGKSNYEDIARSVIVCNNDWRAHIRLYAKGELAALGGMCAMEMTEHRFYRNAAMRFERKKGLSWAVRWLASSIPRFREDQMALFIRSRAARRT